MSNKNFPCKLPKYAGRLFGEEQTTRARSGRQESRNDVFTDYCEVEAKTTGKESFSLKLSDWRKLRKKCSTTKIPILVVDFESSKDSLAVLGYDDLRYLIEKVNRETD